MQVRCYFMFIFIMQYCIYDIGFSYCVVAKVAQTILLLLKSVYYFGQYLSVCETLLMAVLYVANVVMLLWKKFINCSSLLL